jgi:quinol monooxygenase YgiN
VNEHASVIRLSHHFPATGRRDEAAALLKAVAESMRDAPGCFGAQLVSSDRDPEELVLISRWESEEAMERFQTKPEFTGFQREIASSLEGPPQVEIFSTA